MILSEVLQGLSNETDEYSDVIWLDYSQKLLLYQVKKRKKSKI